MGIFCPLAAKRRAYQGNLQQASMSLAPPPMAASEDDQSLTAAERACVTDASLDAYAPLPQA